MKRKVIALVLFLFVFAVSYAQQHIKFNGATFGTTVENFILGFPEKPYIVKSVNRHIFNPELSNGYEGFVKINSDNWKCFILASRISNTVYRTVSINSYTDLENGLMLLVKTLENKYGGAIQEKQEKLGVIKSESYDKGNREMLALYYYVKDYNNKTIGEIRISAAPSNKEATSGWIELSYTDYRSRDLARKEYENIMNNAL